jgi:hypothetical protein
MPPTNTDLIRGQIARLNRSGIGYVTTSDHRASSSEFVFSFDKIRRRAGQAYVPYRGEALQSLGFREGQHVAFSEGADGLIESIELE